MKRRINALCLMLAMSLALTVVSIAQERVHAQPLNQVGLVVDFGNGTISTRCIFFSESEISGYDVLRRSGLPVVADEVSGMGVTICDIGGASGCPASNCFCQCQGMTCKYWTYYRLEGESWQYSPLGASGHTVQHGDVEGWAWGEGNPGSGSQPPVISFDQICAASDAPTDAEPQASPSDTPPPATPTTQATTPPSPLPLSLTGTVTSSPTLTLPRTAPPTPSPTSRAVASLSPSRRASRPTQTTPPQTPTDIVQPEKTDEPATDEAESATPYRSASYVVFSLIIAGLLGWLLFVARDRG